MTLRPAGPELLTIARRAFLDELVPHLPEERRYTALMVANAMGIAARDAEARAEAERGELAMLAWLYGEEALSEAGRDDTTRRIRLRARLAADIRGGRLDSMLEGRLRTLLLERAIASLRISNPKHLRAAGIE